METNFLRDDQNQHIRTIGLVLSCSKRFLRVWLCNTVSPYREFWQGLLHCMLFNIMSNNLLRAVRCIHRVCALYIDDLILWAMSSNILSPEGYINQVLVAPKHGLTPHDDGEGGENNLSSAYLVHQASTCSMETNNWQRLSSMFTSG
jgi:hypothetical protein